MIVCEISPNICEIKIHFPCQRKTPRGCLQISKRHTFIGYQTLPYNLIDMQETQYIYTSLAFCDVAEKFRWKERNIVWALNKEDVLSVASKLTGVAK